MKVEESIFITIVHRKNIGLAIVTQPDPASLSFSYDLDDLFSIADLFFFSSQSCRSISTLRLILKICIFAILPDFFQHTL